MTATSFTDRSYRVDPGEGSVVCDTVAIREQLDPLRDAIAWRRREHSTDIFESAESVLELRDLIALDDLLMQSTAIESETVVTVDREQALSLCEIAGAYVAERDVESFQAPEERERIARLRAIAGPLTDTCHELAAAEREATEKQLLGTR